MAAPTAGTGGEQDQFWPLPKFYFSVDIGDQTDLPFQEVSGLDIDALRIVANGVNALRSKNNATIVVTHYQRLLDYIVPDFVHVLYKGRIVKSGGKELALELEAKGYDWIKTEAALAE